MKQPLSRGLPLPMEPEGKTNQLASCGKPRQHRFHELDLLRFLAALSVMFYHFTYRGNLPDHVPPLCNVAFPSLASFCKYGFLGVNVFFLISGFVIVQSARNRTASEFAFARGLRLYPAYWVCLALTVAAIYLWGSAEARPSGKQVALNMTLFQSLLKVKNVSSVYWTLAVELQFYFLIFCLLLVGQLRRLAVFLTMWLAAVIACFFINPPGVISRFLFPEWAAYFIAGAFFYLIYLQGRSALKIGAVIICYLLSVANAFRSLAEFPSRQYNMSMVSATLFVAYLFFFWLISSKSEGRQRMDFRRIGLVTYPLYLLHETIGYIVLNRLSPHFEKHLLLAVTIVGIVFAAYLVQRYVEAPLSRIIKKAWDRNRVVEIRREPAVLEAAAE
jgi:peptidoglycan/LPS O-acetylase OafA/YrhL